MVNFVCSGCGATLKKKTVAPHLMKCKDSNVSCMDCGTQFKEKEYQAHNTCISEAEKYGHNKNKGKKGGEEQVSKPEQQLDPKEKAYKTFKNVMEHSLNITDEGLTAKIWKMIEDSGVPVGTRRGKKRSAPKDGSEGEETGGKKGGKKAKQVAQNGGDGATPAKKAKSRKNSK